MPVLICLRKELWTGLISVGDQVPTCPVFTRAKIKSHLGILVNFPVTIWRRKIWYYSNSVKEDILCFYFYFLQITVLFLARISLKLNSLLLTEYQFDICKSIWIFISNNLNLLNEVISLVFSLSKYWYKKSEIFGVKKYLPLRIISRSKRGILSG